LEPGKKMKRLIVNADDFGLTDKVNEAIVDGHRNGLITSTTLMAKGQAFESAVELSRQAPRLGVGIHWNLTEGHPVAACSSIPTLADEEGFRFKTPQRLWRALFLGRVKQADIERELRAQIEKILAADISPTHLDSHKHVHSLPQLGKIAVRVAREYGIGAIRVVAEDSSVLGSLLRHYPGSAVTLIRQYLNGCALSLISRGWSRQLRSAGIVRASRFYGFTATGFLDDAVLRKLLSKMRDETSELMCHPGFVDAALRRMPTRLLRQREIEHQALTHPSVKRLVQELGIQLVNYGDIARVKTVPLSQEVGGSPQRLPA
jgi:hopanoid biosynthesis associated protein HpnK